VWTAPPWQELSDLLQHWSGAVMCPACLCGGEAAGHNALRGSGPNQKHAFKDALTQAGSPDPRIDLVCITSSCPRQFLQNFKRRHRCLASPPLIALASTQTSLSHFDAAEWAPSTTSKPVRLRASTSRLQFPNEQTLLGCLKIRIWPRALLSTVSSVAQHCRAGKLATLETRQHQRALPLGKTIRRFTALSFIL